MAGNSAIVSGMAGRYATALFDLAEESGELEKVEGEMAAFSQLIEASDDLARLAKSPVFTPDQQARALTAILDQAGMSGTSANFLKLVASNGRLFAIEDMIRAFHAIVSDHRGEITAQVTSATPLNAQQLASLDAALKETLDKNIIIETDVDASLLGGLIVKVGSRMIDNSLKTKLNKMNIAMKEVR